MREQQPKKKSDNCPKCFKRLNIEEVQVEDLRDFDNGDGTITYDKPCGYVLVKRCYCSNCGIIDEEDLMDAVSPSGKLSSLFDSENDNTRFERHMQEHYPKGWKIQKEKEIERKWIYDLGRKHERERIVNIFRAALQDAWEKVLVDT